MKGRAQTCRLSAQKSEIDKAVVTRRIAPDEQLMRRASISCAIILAQWTSPADEDGLIRFVLDTFTRKQEHYQKLLMMPTLSLDTLRRKL